MAQMINYKKHFTGNRIIGIVLFAIILLVVLKYLYNKFI